MKGNLHIIGLGGAGINITKYVADELKKLEETMAKVDDMYIDTTDKTIQNYRGKLDRFTKITSSKFDAIELDGTGGERKNVEVVEDITNNIAKFMNKNLPNNPNDYYVLIASASGGSGSIISAILAKALRSKDYTTIVVLVGDSSNLLNINNTINTITSMQSIAKLTKTALPIVFFNNTVDGNTTPATEKAVNDKILKMLSIISLFTSGCNQNLDHEDMRKFFNPNRYKTFNVNQGIYNLGAFDKELTDPNTLLVRTLIKEGVDDIKIDAKILHNKVGVVCKKNEDFVENYPLFLTFRHNIMSKIVKDLKQEYEELEQLKRIRYDDFEALDEAIEDDSGLVL